MNILLMPDFVISCISNLENISLLSNIDITNISINHTIPKKPQITFINISTGPIPKFFKFGEAGKLMMLDICLPKF